MTTWEDIMDQADNRVAAALSGRLGGAWAQIYRFKWLDIWTRIYRCSGVRNRQAVELAVQQSKKGEGCLE